MPRPRIAGVVLALGLIATGAAATVFSATNSAPSPTSDFTSSAESTALYCTGLGAGATSGRVTFTNLSGSPRALAVEVVSNTGERVTRNINLAAHSSTSVSPLAWVKGTLFGVSAIVTGGGVVGAEVAANNTAVAPCSAGGVTDWYAAGFDTLVGSSAVISLFNPSATPAVVNVTTVTSSGFAAPAPFQGLAVGPHAEVAVNLASQVVDTANVGVRVNALRGAVAVVGVQTSASTTSFNVGQGLSTSAAFPLVTTAANTRAQVRVANPNDVPASVSVAVALGTYQIAPESVEIPAYASGVVTITPNSAIPAAGYASLTLTSSEPVAAALAVGTTFLTLSAPAPPSRTWLISDFSGRGFSRVALTNSTKSPTSVRVTNVATLITYSATLAAGATSDVRALFPGLSTLQGQSLLVSSDRAVRVTTVLPLSPVGPVVTSALNGG